MIVGSCGFGSTGSSAINDYLLEFDDVQVLDDIEFTWVWAVDSIIDLEFHLMHPHGRTGDSIRAIQRYEDKIDSIGSEYSIIGSDIFRKSGRKFIESITTVKWDWYRFDKESKIMRLFKY